MHLQLSKKCQVRQPAMTATTDGHYCHDCNTPVVDYSGMSDAQMLDHIQRHGLGCGTWNREQLNRPLVKRNKTFLPAFITVMLLLLQKLSFSQDKKQNDSTVLQKCKQSAYESVNEKAIAKERGTGSFIVVAQKFKKKKSLFRFLRRRNS